MTRRTTTAVVVSALALAAAAGCGSTQSRTKQVSAPTGGAVADAGTSPLFSVPTYSVPIDQLTLAEIARELEAMATLDHTLVDASINNPDTVTQARVHEADAAHAARLEEIVNAIGWPTAELVGAPAAQGAFLVIQHAGHDVEFQNRCLGLMVDLVNDGKMPAPYVALLTDRIRLFKGQPQLFGTQMTFVVDKSGQAKAVPSVPIEDIANLDSRRAMMNMPPHDHFARVLEREYEADSGEAGRQSAAVETWTE